MASAEERGLEVIDGTCTWVLAEQRELKKLVDEGYTIVILGHAASTPRRSACSATRRTPSSSTRRRSGSDPAPQADGAHVPEHAAALEVRAPGRVHGLARPRAEDRQHGLPGHHPAPAGHHGAGRAGRPRGRRRRPQQRQHRRADAALPDGRQARHPDRDARTTSRTAAPSRACAWSASRAAPRRPSRTWRRSPPGSTRSPAPPSGERTPRDLAHEALVSVAEPAYRSTSIGRTGRAAPVVTTSGVA